MTAKDEHRILLSPPHMGASEFSYLKEAFESGWITPLGPFLSRFENDFSAYLGAGHAVGLCSGTAAIQLALRLCQVNPGDYVLCSSFTFVASAAPIVQSGCVPVFIDSNEATWNMDPVALKQAVEDLAAKGKKPKALIVVHLYGQPADMDPIIDICQEYGIKIIEDAAESLGTRYKGKFTGTIGHFGVFSFNGNKIITTSGGGMLVTGTSAEADRARYLSQQAKQPALHYEHTELGYNFRMSNLLAAVGVGQLEHLEARIQRRKEINQAYVKALSNTTEIAFMPDPEHSRANYWLSCIMIKKSSSVTAPEVIQKLSEANIEARHLWKPMHMQPVFRDAAYYGDRFSEELFAGGLCLPSGSAMSDADLERVCAELKRCWN